MTPAASAVATLTPGTLPTDLGGDHALDGSQALDGDWTLDGSGGLDLGGLMVFAAASGSTMTGV